MNKVIQTTDEFHKAIEDAKTIFADAKETKKVGVEVIKFVNQILRKYEGQTGYDKQAKTKEIFTWMFSLMTLKSYEAMSFLPHENIDKLIEDGVRLGIFQARKIKVG